MDEQLVRACEIVAYKDAQPLRRAMFDALAARRTEVRLALATWERLRSVRARAAFVSARALSSFLGVRFPRERADLLAVCQYDNERRQIARLRELVPELAIADIACEPALGRLSLSELRKARELIEEYTSEGDFLIAARVAETIGYYLRMLRELEGSAARGVIVSSDSNPYAVALVYAAKRVGKRTCFVTHGHVAEGPPPLDFDLALIDGPAVRDVYERAGPIRGEVVFRGSEGVAASMDASRLVGGVKTLGIVLSILVDWRAVGDLLARVRAELAPGRILLRLHPNEQMREPRWAEGLDLRGVSVSLGERSLVDDARSCELVLAANTSAHLTVLKAGVPSAYVAGLDRLGNDYYGFVRDGIVASASDPQAIADFYSRPDWIERFARYDAGYPDRQASCDRAVAQALRELVDRAEASA